MMEITRLPPWGRPVVLGALLMALGVNTLTGPIAAPSEFFRLLVAVLTLSCVGQLCLSTKRRIYVSHEEHSTGKN